MIESISFGKLLFKGKVSRADTIVFKDHMDTKWWIKSRNCIEMEDLDSVLATSPKSIIVGTGFMNYIKISDNALEELKKLGIEVIVQNSTDAAETFNEKIKKSNTVGLFHLI
jgi:hypothetical protein